MPCLLGSIVPVVCNNVAFQAHGVDLFIHLEELKNRIGLTDQNDKQDWLIII